MAALMRPAFVLLIFMFAQLGTEQDGPRAGVSTVLKVLVATAAWMLSVLAMNELGDEDVDRANLDRHKVRPLVTGELSRSEVWVIAAVAALVAMGGAGLIGFGAVFVVAFGLALGAAYSLPPLRLSRRGPATSLLLPLGYVVVPFMIGSSAVGQLSSSAGASPRGDTPIVLLIVGLYLSLLGRLLLKDFRDLDGDLLYGKRTFLVRYGRITTLMLSAGMWICGGVPIVVAVGSIELASSYGLSALTALWLLNRLAGSIDEHSDDVLIAAIAALGRSVLLSAICVLSARHAEAARWVSPVLVAGSTWIGMAAVGGYLQRPYSVGNRVLRGASRRDHIRYPSEAVVAAFGASSRTNG